MRRINIPEIQTQPKGVANILVTKTQLLDDGGNRKCKEHKAEVTSKIERGNYIGRN
jgi:hypothetical protein